jgi:hypothetical protein
VLIGPRAIGKTLWARSLGPHVYWAGMTDLSTWSNDANYLVMDDFDFDFMPSKKQYFGGQREFTVSDKYVKKKTIRNWSKPLIYLCNEDGDPRKSKYWNQWFTDSSVILTIPWVFVHFNN